MPGKYGIFVAVWINDPLSPLVFSGGCATVGVYSGNNPTGLVDNLVVGAKGKNGFWWHAANIVVQDAVAPPDVFPVFIPLSALVPVHVNTLKLWSMDR